MKRDTCNSSNIVNEFNPRCHVSCVPGPRAPEGSPLPGTEAGLAVGPPADNERQTAAFGFINDNH